MGPALNEDSIMRRCEAEYLDPEEVYGCGCDPECSDSGEHEEKSLAAKDNADEQRFEEMRERELGI